MGSQRTYLEGRGELGNSSLLLIGKHLSEPSPGGAKGPQVSGRLLWALKIWGPADQPGFPTGHRKWCCFGGETTAGFILKDPAQPSHLNRAMEVHSCSVLFLFIHSFTHSLTIH